MDNKIFKIPPEAFPEGTESLENNVCSLKQLPVLSGARAGERSRNPQLLFPEVSRLAAPALCPAWPSLLGHHGEHPWFQRMTVLHWGKM